MTARLPAFSHVRPVAFCDLLYPVEPGSASARGISVISQPCRQRVNDNCRQFRDRHGVMNQVTDL
ncbi:hypothetical protein [Aestuariivita sp.]|jgi:hypothetical protein|uniref:hypothetical protein n=1 Tax=Aestuariivita sp. TaxID=1872407 RepID=UPI002172F0BD|nr:hypothetical protein [Aestuariivita sp.]MCE8007862.1 hypothetical protein [Aestuariivita sp.]